MGKTELVLKYISNNGALYPGYEIRLYKSGAIILTGHDLDWKDNYYQTGSDIIRRRRLKQEQVDEYARRLLKGGVHRLRSHYPDPTFNSDGFERLSFNFRGRSKTITSSDWINEPLKSGEVGKVLSELKRHVGVPEEETLDNLLELSTSKKGRKI